MSNSYSRSGDNKRWDGVFVGTVKETKDAHRTGRLLVWIPEMSSDPADPSGWKMVNYCSPFAGATDPMATRSQNTNSPDNTQTSYGFWAVPPDINNQVLCVFANGKADKGFWIGCLYQNYMNHMVPGIAAGENYHVRDKYADDKSKWHKLPVSEYNKHQQNPPDASKEDRAIRPSAPDRYRGIGAQGLIKDTLRGTNSSTARRETPSSVFGITTPGPLDPKIKGHRRGGNSFVMDDGVDSEYIGFQTRSGASLRIDETNGIIYGINRDGTSWIQMDAEGNFDIFAAKSISMRSQEDINFRADRNINIEAGQNIYMKAAKDTDVDLGIVGEGNGIGGDIYIQALNNEHHHIKNDVYLTVVDGNLNIDVQTGYKREHVKGTVDLSYDSDVTASVVGDVNHTVGGNVISEVIGDVDESYDGNHTVGVGGDVDIGVGGHLHLDTSSDTTIKAPNAILDSDGNLSVAESLSAGGDIVTSGDIKADGVMYATDFMTPSVGLIDHSHKYIPGSGPKVKSDTPLDGGGSGGSASTSPVSASTPASTTPAMPPTAAEVKAMVEKVNVLVGFSDDSWFDRKTHVVKTISDRFMTFEPCDEHKKKGT